jgi:hypothetical protein
MNSPAVPSRKGTVLATQLHSRYSSTSQFSRQSHDTILAERSNLVLENKRSSPKINKANSLNKASDISSAPPWQPFYGDLGKSVPRRSVEKRALRNDPNRDSSAETQSEVGKLQSFSTHRLSVQTNITTPERASYCRPAATTLSLPSRDALNCSNHSTKSITAPLLNQNTYSAVTISSPAHNNISTIMSPRAISLKAKPAVNELTRKLQHHQEELRRLENELNAIRSKPDECLGQANAPCHSGKQIQNIQAPTPHEDVATMDAYHAHQLESPQHGEITSEDQASPTPDEVDKKKFKMEVANEHALNELIKSNTALKAHRVFDRSMLTERARDGYPYSPSPARQSDMHECIWRRLFLEEQRSEFENEGRRAKGDGEVGAGLGISDKDLGAIHRGGNPKGGKRAIGLRGLTVLIHRESGEDLVLVCEP